MRKWIPVCAALLSACAAQRSVDNTPAPQVADTTAAETLAVMVPETPAPPPSPKFPYRAEVTRTFDLLHTRLEVSFDWAQRHLLGSADLTLRPYFYEQQELVLDARGFDLHEVALLDGDAERPLTHAYDGELITIQLDRTYRRNDTLRVRIDYTAKPDELPAGGSAAITSDKGLYFINPDGTDPNKPRQLWTQGETHGSRCWFPTIDHPNERTTQEIYITVEDHFTTVSNGLLVYAQENADGTRTDYWSMKQPHAPYLFMMAVSDFAVVRDEWRGKEVSYYVDSAYAPHARAVFGNTAEMMTFFSDRLGVEYPWDKYAQVVVHDYVSGAMENTSASLFMEDLHLTTRETFDTDWDYIIAHELIHQWFGDLVTCESWSNLPLNESFANYGEYLWAEWKRGRAQADYQGSNELQGYLSEAQRKQVPIFRFHYENHEDMFDAHSYNKGGRVLHMLRKYVGDDAFFTALNRYLTRHAYSDVEIHDLRLAFEEVTGEDLNWFFTQWFLRPGHPQLRVEHSYAGETLTVRVEQQQDTTETPIYRLPLDVEVWSGGEARRYPVVIDEATETFTFLVSARPNWVLFDAEQQLLGVVEHEKSTEELLYQYEHSALVLPRFESLSELAEGTGQPEIVEMMRRALDDPFGQIREQAIGFFADQEGMLGERARIVAMARADTNTSVRATALEAIGQNASADELPVLQAAFTDSSYAVVAAALGGYLLSAPADAGEVLKPFRDEQNQYVVNLLGDYYSTQDDPAHYEWFERGLRNGTKDVRYLLSQYLGRYLLNESVSADRGEGVELLGELAREDLSVSVRFAAYRSLGLLTDVPGVPAMRAEIKENETSAQLRRIYEYMD
ncbi:MAG: M1 family aminopeptidase [Catalinimonas sp.]